MGEINRWIVAAVILCGAIVIGRLLQRMARSALAADRRPQELAEFAPAVGRMISAAVTTIGALIAAAALDPAAFRAVPDEALHALPLVAIAAVVAAIGYALSIAATAALAASTVAISGQRQRGIERLVRAAIVIVTAVVALGIVGVPSSVLAVGLAVTAGPPLVAAAALSALGARSVATHLAARRALAGHLRVGHVLRGDSFEGTIVAMHPVTVELECRDGSVMHVPNAALLSSPFTVEPSRRPAGA